MPRNLTDSFEGDIGSSLTGDQHAPRREPWRRPIWNREQTAIIDVAAEEGRANLVAVDAASGTVAKLTRGDHEVIAFTASGDGSRLALVVADATEPGDLFASSPARRPSSG